MNGFNNIQDELNELIPMPGNLTEMQIWGPVWESALS
jgi:hypothetical protein